MAETTEQKPKRFAIKVLEKDFDQLMAYQEKWTKQKKVEFTLEEVVDYVMQTATVRIDALEKYSKKQKAVRKENPKPKKVKAVKEKTAKPKKAKAPKKQKEGAVTETPAEPAAQEG